MAWKEQDKNAASGLTLLSTSGKLLMFVTPQNLSSFSSLRILSLQSNRITKIQGLESLVSLEELYLSHNGLSKLEGLENNVSHPLLFFRMI
jgi:Leucine-rich repeat (LRR) protein